MAFGDIPIRENDIDSLITAEWFNTIREELLNAFGSGGYVKETALQTIGAGGTFTKDATAFKEMMNVQSDGGVKIMSATPFGASHDYTAGAEIILVGNSDSAVLEIEVNDIDEGFVGNGKIVLSNNEVIVLIYNGLHKRFYRQGDY